MRHAFLRAAASAAMGLLLVTACSTPASRFPIQHYTPVTRSILPLGELELSNTQMRLAALEGEMKLQYVGIMPDTAGTDLAGASVYRVKNATKYFKQNDGKNAYCSEPPRWVAVNSETGAPAWSREIWVGLLTVDEWAKFSPETHNYCAGGDYVRSPG